MIEVDFNYEEGKDGVFMPILRDVVIENLELTESAPLAAKLIGYPEPDRSIIRLSLRNITFTGVTGVMEGGIRQFKIEQNVNEISLQDVYINGEPWTSSAVQISVSSLTILFIFALFFTRSS